MADDWPFLNLNIITPPVERLAGSSDIQDLSLLPFDSSHLEAWTNITFQFDEPTVLFNNQPPASPADTTNFNHPQNPTTQKTSSAINHELYHTSPEIPFELTNDHNVNSFLDSQNPISNSNNVHQLSYLDQPSHVQAGPTADHPIDVPINARSNPTTIVRSSADIHHQSMSLSNNNKSKQVEDHPSPSKNDHTSPGNHLQTSNHSSNDDDDANRIAHDEDKRRRNTLASARFRMKKKMKEQAIERTAREMRDRVSELEKEVDSLKQENKWLRGLIVDSTASKLVSVQAQETAELLESSSHANKRARPTIGLAADSIRVPSFSHKRSKLNDPPAATSTHVNNPCKFSPPPFPQ